MKPKETFGDATVAASSRGCHTFVREHLAAVTGARFDVAWL
jgi:hypothetical protein